MSCNRTAYESLLSDEPSPFDIAYDADTPFLFGTPLAPQPLPDAPGQARGADQAQMVPAASSSSSDTQRSLEAQVAALKAENERLRTGIGSLKAASSLVELQDTARLSLLVTTRSEMLSLRAQLAQARRDLEEARRGADELTQLRAVCAHVEQQFVESQREVARLRAQALVASAPASPAPHSAEGTPRQASPAPPAEAPQRRRRAPRLGLADGDEPDAQQRALVADLRASNSKLTRKLREYETKLMVKGAQLHNAEEQIATLRAQLEAATRAQLPLAQQAVTAPPPPPCGMAVVDPGDALFIDPALSFLPGPFPTGE
eukprot:m51a1_g7503 hypothetical protein (317) ;mRNA; r:278768-279801